MSDERATTARPDRGSPALPGRAAFSPLEQRLLSHYPQIQAIRRGELPYPRMAIVYPVYGCNLDCVGCEYAADNARGFVMLEGDRFLLLMRELTSVGVEGVEFCGGGEPTLHPQFVEAIRFGGELGLRFGLLTNGTALGPRFFSEALEHLAYVRVSFDAATEATYARARPAKGRNPWRKLVRNFTRLAEERARRGLAFDLSFKFLVSRVNRHELRAAVELARELGADAIQIKALRQDPAELSPAETETVAAELAALRKAYAPFPVLGDVRKLTMRRSCILTPLQVTIDAYGDVFLCCYFRHRRERHRIGNLYERPFRELWGSERHRAAIAAIQPAECSRFDCRFIRYHELLDELLAHPADFSFI